MHLFARTLRTLASTLLGVSAGTSGICGMIGAADGRTGSGVAWLTGCGALV